MGFSDTILSFNCSCHPEQMEEEHAFGVIRYMMFVLGFRRQYKPDMVALQVLILVIVTGFYEL